MKVTQNRVLEVIKNSLTDEGEGVVSFKPALIITDNTRQRNGTQYDIETLDITKYAGQLTADHEDKLRNIIGRVEGVKKNGNTVTIDRIIYAVKENPHARIAYNLLVGGFSKAFSTETIGPSPDPTEGIHYSHELVGLSQVVVPNNYSAVVNQVVKNSLEQAMEDGLDIDGIEEEFLKKEEETVTEEEAKKTEVENTEVQEETEKVENTTEQQETQTEVETVDNEVSDKVVEDLTEAVKELIALEKEKMKETGEKGLEEIVEENSAEESTEEELEMTKEELQKEINSALEGFARNFYAQQAKAPQFKNEAEVETEEVEKTTNAYEKMDWKERYQVQINSAWDALRTNNLKAHATLQEVNEVNYNKLREAGIVANSMTIQSMGNFVMPPEMYKEIVGARSDYSPLLDATTWRETNSIEYAWVKRKGTIDMENVEFCDDSSNGNLKPIKKYTLEQKTSKLEEMAAVTPVCNAVTRFHAIDLLADVAAEYRHDYDRKRAQLVVALMQQAVAENSQSVQYTKTDDTDAMVAWLETIAKVSDSGVNGTLIFNNKTFAKLKAHALRAGVAGPLAEIFTTGEVPMIFGTPYIVVPNDLMPTVESEDDIQHQVKKQKVKIEHAAFYADLSQFIGYTSGGLQYDLSTEASYEDSGTVKSAYQRNEMVLRGSFFRGGAIRDISRVAGIKAAAL